MSTQESSQTKSYEKYLGSFRKQSLYSMVKNAILLLLTFILIFAPIYKTSYEWKFSVNDFSNMNDYLSFIATLTPEEVLNGSTTITKNFSIFDELLYTLDSALSKSDSIASIMSTIFLLFPLSTVIMGCTALFTCAKQLYESFKNYKETDQFAMLEYYKIKKSGDNEKKKSLFKGQISFSFIIYSIMTPICSRIFMIFIEKTLSMASVGNIGTISLFADFGGLSIWVVPAILGLVGFAAISFLYNKESKATKAAIIQEDFLEDKTEQNVAAS